jgi:hypothetical protein
MASIDWPLVYILLVTYDRVDEIQQTIRALHRHILYPRDRLRFHLADDHSPPVDLTARGEGHGNEPYEHYIRRQFPDLTWSVTQTDRKGWGANVNKGMDHCLSHVDYVFLIEDDYVALRDVNLRAGVALLESVEDRHKPAAAWPRRPISAVRYDGIAAHWLHLQLREAKTRLGPMQYLAIDHNSPFLNVYSNRPHLMHRRFRDAYGRYPEGLSLADTEDTYAHRVKEKISGPWVVTLWDGVPKAFDHVGHSRQGSQHDTGGQK